LSAGAIEHLAFDRRGVTGLAAHELDGQRLAALRVEICVAPITTPACSANRSSARASLCLSQVKLGQVGCDPISSAATTCTSSQCPDPRLVAEPTRSSNGNGARQTAL